MFLKSYVNNTYFDIFYSNYDHDYLSVLDEKIFSNVYNLLKGQGFYFIDDIIINYLELFEIDCKYIEKALVNFRENLGEDYINQIGKDMTLINKLEDLAISYSEDEVWENYLYLEE